MKRNYNDAQYKKWRIDVKKRDGNKCRFPGCSAKGARNLEVHHIVPWSVCSELRCNVSNGISLCRKCHRSIKGKEAIYRNMFRAILDG